MSFYKDSFIAAGATSLVNHTSDSGATYSPHPAFMSPVPAAIEIPAGIRMRGNAATPNVFNISQAAPGPDHSMTCKVYIASTGSVTETGVICRVTTTGKGNWYSLTINNGSVHLYKNLSQIYTQLGLNVSISESAGASFNLTLACLGSIITGMVTRDSDGFYLTSAGTWQAAPTNVFSFVDNSVPPTNNVGVWISSIADTDTTGYQMASASGARVPALAPTGLQVLDVMAGFGAAGLVAGSIQNASIASGNVLTGSGFFPSHVGMTMSVTNGTSGPPCFNAALLTPPAAPSLCAQPGGSLPATTYYARISYQTFNGESTPSAEATLAVPANNLLRVGSPPPATSPNGVSATGWNVYVSAQLPVPTFPGTGVFTGASNTSGVLVGGTNYFYKVTALDTVGETTASTEVNYPVPPGTNTNQITLNWNAVAGAVAYRIYRSTTTGGELLIAQTAATGTSYTDSVAVTPTGSPPSSNTTGQGAEAKQNSAPLTISVGTNWPEPSTGLPGVPFGTLITTIQSYQSSTQVTLASSWPFTGGTTSLTSAWGIDDTVPIQAAINAATSGQQAIVFFPAPPPPPTNPAAIGSYFITGPLKLGNPGNSNPPGVAALVICGAGTGNVGGHSVCTCIGYGGPVNQPVIQIDGADDLCIRDLVLGGPGGSTAAPQIGIQLKNTTTGFFTGQMLIENVVIGQCRTAILADYTDGSRGQGTNADITCHWVNTGCYDYGLRVLSDQGLDYWLRSFYVGGTTTAVQFDQGGSLNWQGGLLAGVKTVLKLGFYAGGMNSGNFKLDSLRLEQNGGIQRTVVDSYNGGLGIFGVNNIDVTDVYEVSDGNDPAGNPLFNLGPGSNVTVRSGTFYRTPLAKLTSSAPSPTNTNPNDTSLLLDSVAYVNQVPFAAAIIADANSYWRSRNCRTAGPANNQIATPRFDESTWIGDGVVAPFRAACFNTKDVSGNVLCRGYFRPGNRQSKYVANEFPYAQLVYGTCTGVFRTNPAASPPVIPAVPEDEYPGWFDGSSFITMSYSALFDFMLNASGTIAAWIRIPSSVISQNLVLNPIYSNLDTSGTGPGYGGMSLQIGRYHQLSPPQDFNNIPIFQVNDGVHSLGAALLTSNPISGDTWCLVAGVKSTVPPPGTSTLTVWLFSPSVPGGVSATASTYREYSQCNRPRCVGRDDASNTNMNGYIESVMLFAGALTQAQLSALYQTGLNGG